MNKINPDLQSERQNCTFNVKEFAVWWHGGRKQLNEKKILENIFLNDPELKDELPSYYMSHKEVYESNVKLTVKIIEKFRKLQKETNEDFIKNMNFTDFYLKGFLSQSPIGLNFIMFIPTILSLGTEEQHKMWIPKASKCEIIGTYAQTELGHGTFIRGLETRADYDPTTEEFILNSPTLTSYKWWPGSLALTSNYAIVIAQLYSKNHKHGIFQFVVQLRDENTHIPVKGIKIGSIGSKFDMNFVDNGYLCFENLRIPRKNMLMGNAQLLKDGTFIKPKLSILTYAPMTAVRVGIVRNVSVQLLKAATIATRYSGVRRQSPIEPDKPEPKIMDHVTQQLKLFPQIAKAIIFKLNADYVMNLSIAVRSELNKGSSLRLAELHALSCGLKAVCSADASAGIEILRLACGGHGYMASSNLPSLYGLTTAACTYEGENTVLLLQTGRYLLKAWEKALKGEILPPSIAFLADATKNKNLKFDGSIESIIKIFEITAARKICLAFEHFEERKRQNIKTEVAYNLTGIEITQAAELYCRAFILSTGYSEIKKVCETISPLIAKVLNKLIELHAVDALLNKLGEILRFSNLSENTIRNLQERLELLLSEIRPNAVGIVDGFDFHDEILKSALGAYDGNVYERLYNEAQKSPLNKEPVNESFHLYLKPFMKSHI